MRKLPSLPLILLSCCGVLIGLGALISAVFDTWKVITPPAISAQSQIIIDNSQSQSLTTADVSPGMVKLFKSIVNGLSLAILEETAGIEAIAEPNGQYSYVYHQNKGILPTVDLAMSTVTDIPVSGASYVASNLQHLGLNIAPSVRAQGYGYTSLSILQDAWRVFRNVAYVFFTIIIIAVGFMILFQQKLDGSLVVTIQKSLPRIVLSLILVTFSYAIVGFMIDAMYLIMYLVGGLFNWNGDAMARLMGGDIFTILGELLGGSIGGTWRLYGRSVSGVWNTFLPGDTGSGGGAVEVIGGILLALLGWLIPLILTIILFFAMLVATWKIFKSLTKSYVIIIFNLIFAPIQLMLGALPTKDDYTKKWFLSLAGNLSPFVGIFIMLTVSKLLYAIETGNPNIGATPNNSLVGQVSAQGQLFLPPFMAGVGWHNTAEIALVVAQLGLILSMPEILEKIKEKFGANKGFLGEFVQAAVDRVKENLKGAPGELGADVASLAATHIPGVSGFIGQNALMMQKGLQKAAAAEGITGKIKAGIRGWNEERKQYGKTVDPAQRQKNKDYAKAGGQSRIDSAIQQGRRRAIGGKGVDPARFIRDRLSETNITAGLDFKEQQANATYISTSKFASSTRKIEARRWIAANPNDIIWAQRGFETFDMSPSEIKEKNTPAPASPTS